MKRREQTSEHSPRKAKKHPHEDTCLQDDDNKLYYEGREENIRKAGKRKEQLTHDTKDLLQHHQNCDIECPLHKDLFALDATATVKDDCPVRKQVIADAQHFVGLIVENLAKSYPSFTITPKLKGSMQNGLKVGPPDEIDFLLEFEDMPLEQKDGWELTGDELFFLPAAKYSRLGHVGFESCYQIMYRVSVNKTAPEMLCAQPAVFEKLGLTYDARIGHYLSADRFKEHFRKSVTEACETMSETASENQTNPSYFYYDGYSSNNYWLLSTAQGVKFGVSIDLTPCIHYIYTDGKVVILVPSSSAGTWQRTNEDPAETMDHDHIVSKSIRVLKTLTDNQRESDNEWSMYFSAIYYILYKDTDGSIRCDRSLCKTLTHYFAQTVFAHPSKVPSYAVVGSAVQCYRQLETKPVTLCTFVLEVLSRFQLTDFNNVPLLMLGGKHVTIYEVLCKCVQILRKLGSPSLSEEARSRVLTDMLPISYKYPASLFRDHIRAEFPVPTEYSHPDVRLLQRCAPLSELQVPTPTRTCLNQSTEKRNEKWEVYKIEKESFATWLGERYPVMNRENPTFCISSKPVAEGIRIHRSPCLFFAMFSMPRGEICHTSHDLYNESQSWVSLQKFLKDESAVIEKTLRYFPSVRT